MGFETASSSQAQDGILRAVLVNAASGNILWEIESLPDDVFKDPNSYPGQIIVRSGFAVLSPSGRHVIAYFQWDLDDRGEFLINGNTGEFIRKMQFSDTKGWKILNNDKLLTYQDSGAQNYNVSICDLASGNLLHDFAEPAFEQIVRSGNQLYAWYPQDNAIRAYETQGSIKSEQYSSKEGICIFTFQISCDGRKILYDDNTRSLHIGELARNQDTGSGEIVKQLTLIDIDPGIVGSGILFFDNCSGKYVGIVTREKREIWLWDLEELGLSGVKQGEEYR